MIYCNDEHWLFRGASGFGEASTRHPRQTVKYLESLIDQNLGEKI